MSRTFHEGKIQGGVTFPTGDPGRGLQHRRQDPSTEPRPSPTGRMKSWAADRRE